MEEIMSSKAQQSASKEPIQGTTSDVHVQNPMRDEEIRRLAYEIYLERGDQPGDELDDWLKAELEREARWHEQAS
jgi:hypothetical protein